MAAAKNPRNAEATRTLLIDTAMAVFAHTGYRGASIRDIAARAGVSHPTLLYHFPSKAHLLMAVLERRDHLDCDDIEGGGPTFHDLPARAMLEHLVDSARRNASQRGIVELFAQLSAEASDPDHPAHAFFAARYEALRADLSRAFAELARDGDLRDGVEPSVAAAVTVAVMDGLQIQWLIDPAIDMADALARHFDGAVLAPGRALRPARTN